MVNFFDVRVAARAANLELLRVMLTRENYDALRGSFGVKLLGDLTSHILYNGLSIDPFKDVLSYLLKDCGASIFEVGDFLYTVDEPQQLELLGQIQGLAAVVVS